MKKTVLFLVILAISTLGYGQTIDTKYFNNASLGKEVSPSKAKFSQSIIQNDDGSITTEIKDLKKNEIIERKTYKENEPYGIWKFRYNSDYKTLDYNFPLIYDDVKCKDSLHLPIVDFFKDYDSVAYKAPIISNGELSFYQFIGRNIIYPFQAREAGIQGTVYLQLTLTMDGTFEDIVIKRGANISLDKEAVRVLRMIKFTTPPKINGQACTFKCLNIPIRFQLR